MFAMKFHTELSYDASPDEVLAMLSDPAFRERVCEAQDVVSHDVTLELSGAGFTVVVDMVQRTEGLPSIAKKFAGDTTRAVLEEHWKDGSGGSLSITAPGKPTTSTGTVRLSAAGAGTTQVVDLDVKVKVPLIGGKLEALVAQQIQEGYDIEHQVGVAWLAGQR